MQWLALVAAVATATAIVLGLSVRRYMREVQSLRDVIKSQAVAVRSAQMAADDAMRVMQKAQADRDSIVKESDERLKAMETQKIKLLRASVDPERMAEAWNEVFSKD